MSSASAAKNNDPVWPPYFAEIALRAIRRLHWHYNLWDLGQPWKKNAPTANPNRMNLGLGIELALETDVCAAISQEFLASPFTTGAYVANDGEARCWEIEREIVYANGGQSRCDFVIRRVNCQKSAYIEAKRAYNWSTKLSGPTAPPTDNLEDIIDDIKYLRDDAKNLDIYRYVFVWGIFDPREKKLLHEGPDGFLKRLKKKQSNLKRRELRWLPIIWSSTPKKPKIQRWAWMQLIECE